MKMIGIAKKPEMRTVTQHTIFVPTADSCFSKGVQIFLYLSMAIRSRLRGKAFDTSHSILGVFDDHWSFWEYTCSIRL
jgi:hypothetical protein